MSAAHGRWSVSTARWPGPRLLLSLLFATGCCWLRPALLPAFFAVNNAPQASDTQAQTSQFLPKAGVREVHSSQLLPLDHGDLLAYWFGGSREGAGDVAIWQARRHNGLWSPAHAILRRRDLAASELRYVRKLGNAVPVQLANGDLALYVVSTGLGGWATSSLNRSISHDQGQTWEPAQRLVTSPLFNISTLVRNSAIPLTDGGFYLPVYHESARKFPQLLRFDAQGELVDMVRMSASNGYIQPSVVARDEQNAIAFLRDTRRQFIHWQSTTDSGQHWSAPQPLPLDNPDAAIAAARLPDGRLLLLYNDQNDSRNQLATAISSDGQHWQAWGWLERDPQRDHEYSYPALSISGQHIDISYTWRREQIRYRHFPDLASLRGQP